MREYSQVPDKPEPSDYDCSKLVHIYDEHNQHVLRWRVYDDLDKQFLLFEQSYDALSYLQALRMRRARVEMWLRNLKLDKYNY